MGPKRLSTTTPYLAIEPFGNREISLNQSNGRSKHLAEKLEQIFSRIRQQRGCVWHREVTHVSANSQQLKEKEKCLEFFDKPLARKIAL